MVKITIDHFDIGAIAAMPHAHAGTDLNQWATCQGPFVGARLQRLKDDFRFLIGAGISAHTQIGADVNGGGWFVLWIVGLAHGSDMGQYDFGVKVYRLLWIQLKGREFISAVPFD